MSHQKTKCLFSFPAVKHMPSLSYQFWLTFLPVTPTHPKKLQITVLYTYFNFCTGKEKEGVNEDRLVYSDSIFAFKLIFALGGREGKKDRKTSKHKSQTVPRGLVWLPRDPKAWRQRRKH